MGHIRPRLNVPGPAELRHRVPIITVPAYLDANMPSVGRAERHHDELVRHLSLPQIVNVLLPTVEARESR